MTLDEIVHWKRVNNQKRKKETVFGHVKKKPPTTNSVPQKLFVTNKNKFVKEIVEGGGGIDESVGRICTQTLSREGRS